MARQSTSHIDDPAALGQRLRQARLEKGVTQASLVFPGCTIGHISRIEAGLRTPSLQVVRRLADQLGVDEDWLATGKARPPEPDEVTRLRDAELALRLGDADLAEEIYTTLANGNVAGLYRAAAEAGLGQIAYERGRLREAIEKLEAAFALEPDLDDPGAAETLGRAYAQIEDYNASISLFRRSLAAAAERNDPIARLRFGTLLANALTDTAQLEEANTLLNQLLEDTHGGDPIQLARLYWTQSRVHIFQREPEEATRLARRAVEILDATEHSAYRVRAHTLLAFAELESGNAYEALRLVRAAKELLGPESTSLDRLKLAIEEARALVLLGELDEGASVAMAAIGAGADESGPAELGRAYGELASAFAAQDDLSRAAELYELAISMLETLPNRFLADAYRRYAEVLERAGRKEDALEYYKRGLELVTAPPS